LRKLLRSITVLLSLLAALALVVITLSVYVDPSKLYVFAFMGYIFPVVWGVNFIALGYWGVRMKKQIIIPLVALFIGWGQWQDTFQWSGESVEDVNVLENPVTIMTFNVKMFDLYHWSGRRDILDKTFDYIRKKNPDIVCFQEFYATNDNRKFSENYIVNRLKQYPYRHIEYQYTKHTIGRAGLAVFSKYPVRKKQVLRFENTTNFTIQTDISIRGKNVRLFNTHLESMRLNKQDIETIDKMKSAEGFENEKEIIPVMQKLGKAFKRRAYQADVISKHVKNSAYPVIICGDFNDSPVSYTYRTMRGDLKDAFVEAGKGFGGTYNGRLPSFRIDYILFDPSFDAYNYKRDKVELSDHYPVTVTLDLNNKVSKK